MISRRNKREELTRRTAERIIIIILRGSELCPGRTTPDGRRGEGRSRGTRCDGAIAAGEGCGCYTAKVACRYMGSREEKECEFGGGSHDRGRDVDGEFRAFETRILCLSEENKEAKRSKDTLQVSNERKKAPFLSYL